MRRTLVFALLLALTVLTAPSASAQTADVLAPCTNTSGATVVTAAGLSTDIAAPAQPLYLSTTSKTFLLDLAGNPVANNLARVDIEMTWTIPVEDYDLDMLDAGGTELSHSENVQPIDTGEAVSGTVGHCKRFSVNALNWVAAGQSAITLDLTVAQLP